MFEAGVDDGEFATMTYGEEKSRNDFAEETVGLVYGYIDPGDDYVLDLLAECGLIRFETGEVKRLPEWFYGLGGGGSMIRNAGVSVLYLIVISVTIR
jgi:hypothetical protein